MPPISRLTATSWPAGRTRSGSPTSSTSKPGGGLPLPGRHQRPLVAPADAGHRFPVGL